MEMGTLFWQVKEEGRNFKVNPLPHMLYLKYDVIFYKLIEILKILKIQNFSINPLPHNDASERL